MATGLDDLIQPSKDEIIKNLKEENKQLKKENYEQSNRNRFRNN